MKVEYKSSSLSPIVLVPVPCDLLESLPSFHPGYDEADGKGDILLYHYFPNVLNTTSKRCACREVASGISNFFHKFPYTLSTQPFF